MAINIEVNTEKAIEGITKLREETDLLIQSLEKAIELEGSLRKERVLNLNLIGKKIENIIILNQARKELELSEILGGDKLINLPNGAKINHEND